MYYSAPRLVITALPLPNYELPSGVINLSSLIYFFDVAGKIVSMWLRGRRCSPARRTYSYIC